MGDVRGNGLKLLMQHTEERYGRALEQAVFESFADEKDYRGKIRSLVFNLRRNREFIMGHDPSVVVKMDDVALSTGTQVHVEREKVISETVQSAAPPAPKVEEGFIKCRVCKSTNVNYTEKQLRGADEPMTVFAKCENCGQKWKM